MAKAKTENDKKQIFWNYVIIPRLTVTNFYDKSDQI